METVIADAGPLVAYLKRDDADHVWAREAFQRLTPPLLTCDAALGEAFFLLQQTVCWMWLAIPAPAAIA